MQNLLKPNKKNIVILGAGFCGIQAAKKLAKKLNGNKEYRVVLVDRRNMHVYNGDLYEISTAYNERITNACMNQLKDAVTISLKKTLRGLHVLHIKDTILKIDHQTKKISLGKSGSVNYEYLVVALGSVTNFYNIPGLEEHSFPLKTVENALAINCHLDQFFRERWEKKQHHKVHIAIGGGGLTGVEFACELVGSTKHLAKKYQFKREDVTISIIQGNDEFVGLGKKVSDITIKRFKKLGIQPITNAHIAGYDGKTLTICNKEGVCKRNLEADILVWTGGVKPNPLLLDFQILDTSGCMETNQTLESPHYPKVYAGGDCAAVFDSKHHQMVPKIAQLAIQQGRLIAHNICADINNKNQRAYKPLFKGYIVPLGGTYFVYHNGNITFAGIIPYIMRRYVDFTYFTQLLPFGAAVKKWFTTENIFLQND